MLGLRALFTSLFIITYTLAFSTVALVTFPLSPRGELYLFFAQVWSRVILRVGGIAWRVEVHPDLDLNKSYLYLANHESLTDILALHASAPQKIVMVAKRSLLILPVFSWGMWLAGYVFINRKNREAAYRSMHEAGRRIVKGRSVLVFPEGTRGDGGALQKFKRGGFVLAHVAQIPVVPVAIVGTQKVLPRDHFCVYPGRLGIVFGKPLPPPQTEDELPAYMDRVRDEVDRLRQRARELSEGLTAELGPTPGHPRA
ncbi:MAG: lysophospholipid acyltransferase family protein [Polyangia bacterium]